jgi:hypothetical protein
MSAPWHPFLNEKFGKYVLINYKNLLPYNHHDSNKIPVYIFTLTDNATGNTVNIELNNILQLEKWCRNN